MKRFRVVAICLALVLGLAGTIFAISKLTAKSHAHATTSCCKEGASCCNGGSCCETSHSAKQTASTTEKAACCGDASCCSDGKCKKDGACCGNMDACPMKKQAAQNATQTGVTVHDESKSCDQNKQTAGDKKDCCGSGADCCNGGACCKAKTQSTAKL